MSLCAAGVPREAGSGTKVRAVVKTWCDSSCGLGRSPAHLFLRRNRRLGRVCALVDARHRRSEGRCKRWHDFSCKLAHEHRAVLLAELQHDIIDRESLDKCRAVGVHVAYGAEDAQQVQSDDRLAVPELVDDAPEELRFGDTDCDRARDAEDLEEGVEQVLEGVGLRRDEASEQRFQRRRLQKLIFDLRSVVLQPARMSMLSN